LDLSSIRLTSANVAALPQFLKAGAGWMIGGGLKAGALLGTRVVFDEEDEHAALNEDLYQRALAAWKSWSEITGIADYSAILHGLNKSWLHQWPAPAASIIGDVAALRRFHRGGLNDEDFGGLVRAGESATNVFKDCFTKLAGRALAEHQGMFGVNRTRFALRDPATTVERLDEATVIQELRARGIPPAPIPPPFVTSASLVRKLWTGFLYSSPDAISFFDIAEKQQSAAGVDPSVVVIAALEGAIARRADLTQWHGVRSRLSPQAHATIEQEVRTRVSLLTSADASIDRVAIEYVLFGNDAGGERLCSSAIASRLIECLLEHADGKYSKDIRRWLDAVAASPLRRALPMLLKRRLATEAEGVWKYFSWLERAMYGEPKEPASIRPPEAEFKFLFEELEQFCEAMASTDVTPNLRSIAKLFNGELPPHIIDSFERLNPVPLEKDRLERWLEGWDKLNRHETRLAEEDRIRWQYLIRERHSPSRRSSWLAPRDRTQWRNTFQHAEQENGVLIGLDALIQAAAAARSGDARAVLDEVVVNEAHKIAAALNRHQPVEEVESKTFQSLSEVITPRAQDRLLSAIFEAYRSAGRNLPPTWHVFLGQRIHLGKINGHDAALIHFLLNDENRSIRAQAAKSYGFTDAELSNILRRSRTLATKGAARS
jgi:hypothetical protein